MVEDGRGDPDPAAASAGAGGGVAVALAPALLLVILGVLVVVARLLGSGRDSGEGVGRSKVYDLMRSGALASVKIGGSRRIPVEALRQFVESLARAA